MSAVCRAGAVRRSPFWEVKFPPFPPTTLDGQDLLAELSLLDDSFSVSLFIIESISAIAVLSLAMTAGNLSIAAVTVVG